MGLAEDDIRGAAAVVVADTAVPERLEALPVTGRGPNGETTFIFSLFRS
jgi:hypothetical protein